MAKLPIYYATEVGSRSQEQQQQQQQQQQLVRQEQPQHLGNCEVDGAFFLNLNYQNEHHEVGQPVSAYAAAYVQHQQHQQHQQQPPSDSQLQLQLPLRPMEHRSPSPSAATVPVDSSGARPHERSESAPAAESSDPHPPPRRSRGRPRLETQDRNASDRRRTQIRLAQRQYRQRKEARMAALEWRVGELSRLNDSMSSAISHFYDALLAEHVLEAVPHATQRLQLLGDRLLALVCASKNVGEDTGGSQASEAEEEPHSAHSLGAGGSAAGLYPYAEVNGGYPPHHGHVQGAGHGAQAAMHLSSSMAYEMVTQPTADNASYPMYASTESYQVYCPSPCQTLPPPASSFAAQDVTFGRRFQRASIEAGLRLVTMPHPPAERYAAVFGFDLFFEPRETITRRLRLLLGRADQGGVRCWRAPFTNANPGDQFLLASQRVATTSPATGESKVFTMGNNHGQREYGGQQQPQRQETSAAGPLSLEGEAMRGERFYRRVRMLLPGLEGELLDADEVDVYLGRLGVFVPQGAEVVEADLNVGEVDDGAAVWAPLTCEADGPATTPVTVSDGVTASQPRATPALRNGNNDGLGPFALPEPSGHNMPWATAPTTNWCQAKVTINVNVLMKELVHRFICLGMTPTVRRTDVNRAVRLAARMAP
ncbi:hypothetical protein XA68_17558 [Ophiocordyceps unilateralis]|uniref:BZIP domain-containing protein n=1 Tax=Ophiocordyceps unilateralis TaxID=268505 RepID=A0A2A9P4C7_OPHUN|nr:hypothetical protein XA68_17558 [Ophiocordyceps unilateralis]